LSASGCKIVFTGGGNYLSLPDTRGMAWEGKQAQEEGGKCATLIYLKRVSATDE